LTTLNFCRKIISLLTKSQNKLQVSCTKVAQQLSKTHVQTVQLYFNHTQNSLK